MSGVGQENCKHSEGKISGRNGKSTKENIQIMEIDEPFTYIKKEKI
jgi:hypothetical protein